MKSSVKLTTIIAATFFGLILLGFGCKGLSSGEQAATAPITLDYWTVFDDVDALRSQISKYTASRPYLNVRVRQLRANDLYPAFIEALADDRGPDIISIRNRWISRYQNKLAPMPATIRDTTVRQEKAAIGTETIISTFNVDGLTLTQLDNEYVTVVKKDVVRGDQIYGLPLSVDTMALYYNKDLLDRAGIPVPPANWEEFQEAVKKTTKFNPLTGELIQSGAAMGTGSNLPGVDDLLYMLLNQSGLQFTDNSGRAVFNERASGDRSAKTPVMQVLDFYTDFANPLRDTYSWNSDQPDALDAFIAGRTAFFFGYSYHHSLIKARAPQLNFKVLPMLQLRPDSPSNGANYWVQSVVGKSKRQNEAWGLILFLTHSTVTKEYLDATGRPSALRTYIPEQSQDLALSPFVAQVLTAENWYRGRNYEAALRAVQELVEEWLVPAPDPRQAGNYRQDILNRAASKINQTL